ncbi:MAG: hypothetical protein UZ14_CFX002002700 [Chloroflexi bacterium OLB14]|nr:MAG: hypothetical protein UZ14_CFX002002700 [Chloroflexi bacterium OLB14]
MKLKIFYISIFFVYAVIRVLTTFPAIHAPRDLADTDIYVRISTSPIISTNFLYLDRPFVFPFLLQMMGQNFEMVAIFQLGLTIVAWGLLAYLISASFTPLSLKLFSFTVILAVSLVRHLAGWDFVMMTESLSLSIFALFIASGIWLLRGWQIYKIVICLIFAFLFAFTRDTNAYLLLMFAGLMLIAIVSGWLNKKFSFLVLGFVAIFFISNLSADLSKRWVFPLLNIISTRILPNPQALSTFSICGMPITSELLSVTGLYANENNSQIMKDPALEKFRLWVAENGKSCYMKWLISNPIPTMQAALKEFDAMIYFEWVGGYFSRKYQDILPSKVERILYPVYFLPYLLVGLTLLSFYGIFKQAWLENPLWIIAIMLCLTIFPHLYITWHGDDMAPERHALSVGMQLAVSMWLFFFLNA